MHSTGMFRKTIVDYLCYINTMCRYVNLVQSLITWATCIPSFPSTLEIVQQGQRNLRMWTVHTDSQLLCSLLRQPPQAHFCSAASVVQHHLRKITSKLLGDDM